MGNLFKQTIEIYRNLVIRKIVYSLLVVTVVLLLRVIMYCLNATSASTLSVHYQLPLDFFPHLLIHSTFISSIVMKFLLKYHMYSSNRLFIHPT